MRLYNDPANVVGVRWYRCEPGAKWMEGFSPYRSASTWDQSDELQFLGERLRARDTKYDKGANVRGYQGVHDCIPLDGWENGFEYELHPPEVTYNDGSTECCPSSPVNPRAFIGVERMGQGWVVLFGGPSVLVGLDTDFNPVPAWNAELYEHLAQFMLGKSRASVGPVSHWALGAIGAQIGDLGSASASYGPMGLSAFVSALAGYGVLWAGVSPLQDIEYDPTPDYLHPALAPAVRDWIRAGGVFCLVGIPDEYRDALYRLNTLLEWIGSTRYFAERDGPRPMRPPHGLSTLVDVTATQGPSGPNVIINQDNTAPAVVGYNQLVDGTGYVWAPVSLEGLTFGRICRLHFLWNDSIGPAPLAEATGARITINLAWTGLQTPGYTVSTGLDTLATGTVTPGSWSVVIGDATHNPAHYFNGNKTLDFAFGLMLYENAELRVTNATVELWYDGVYPLTFTGPANPLCKPINGWAQPGICGVQYQYVAEVFPSYAATWGAAIPLVPASCPGGAVTIEDVGGFQALAVGVSFGQSAEGQDASGQQIAGGGQTGESAEGLDAGGQQVSGGAQDDTSSEGMDASGQQFSPPTDDFMTGMVVGWPAASATPAGWLDCDGAAVSETTYADLFAVIGYTWGNPGGGNFNLPDFRGRALIGDGTGPGFTARTVGDTGGAETHQLTAGELPFSGNAYRVWLDTGGTPGTSGNSALAGNGGFHDHTLCAPYDAADGAHNNMQPFAAVKMLIKT